MEDVSEEYFPKPSSVFLPDWYKKTQSYLNNKKEYNFNNETSATIKKCIPVFDVLTSGYIIPTYTDVWIKKDDNGNILYLPSGPKDSISFHNVIQAPYHPYMNQHPYPKFNNPWAIKTPKGYSCLFIPPVHGGNEYFSIAEGIVDTDRYNAPVNFPFVLKDVNFEGLIPAGTPMVQVIPFKRDSWESKVGDQNDIDNIKSINNKLISKFYDRYKSLFWTRKNYK
jgi:hypothetical protein